MLQTLLTDAWSRWRRDDCTVAPNPPVHVVPGSSWSAERVFALAFAAWWSVEMLSNRWLSNPDSNPWHNHRRAWSSIRSNWRCSYSTWSSWSGHPNRASLAVYTTRCTCSDTCRSIQCDNPHPIDTSHRSASRVSPATADWSSCRCWWTPCGCAHTFPSAGTIEQGSTSVSLCRRDGTQRLRRATISGCAAWNWVSPARHPDHRSVWVLYSDVYRVPQSNHASSVYPPPGCDAVASAAAALPAAVPCPRLGLVSDWGEAAARPGRQCSLSLSLAAFWRTLLIRQQQRKLQHGEDF